MRFAFTVEVEATYESGKFASKDELADQIQEALEGGDPGQLEGDEGATYSVDSWTVSRDFDAEKPIKKSRG